MTATFSYDKTNILFPSYRGRLPEGITYDARNNTLLWVDIINAELHRAALLEDSNDLRQHEVLKIPEKGESIGALFLTRDTDTVLVCAKYGLAKAEFKAKKIQYILKYPLEEKQAARLRSNDGIIDPWGHLWIGLMVDFGVEEKTPPEGLLYHIDAETLSVKLMIDKAAIANGMAFDEHNRKLYWTDSKTFKVWTFDYDPDSVSLSNRQVLIDMKDIFPENDSPEPDGLAMSKDSHIFHAVFGTSTVLEYTVNGKLQAKYQFPAQRLTCTALGGKNDNELFVTSGHPQLLDSGAEIDPNDKEGDLGGYLFRVRLDKKVHSNPKAIWGGQP